MVQFILIKVVFGVFLFPALDPPVVLSGASRLVTFVSFLFLAIPEDYQLSIVNY